MDHKTRINYDVRAVIGHSHEPFEISAVRTGISWDLVQLNLKGTGDGRHVMAILKPVELDILIGFLKRVQDLHAAGGRYV